MNSVLVVFESKYGQAEKIAAFARDVARRRGMTATAIHVDAAERVDVAAHRAVIVVAPVYFGRHPRTIARFLRIRADVLSSMPTAFVSVSNSAASTSAAVRANARRIATAFVSDLGFRPKVLSIAGGALAYPRYGFFLRFMMKRIARRAGGPLDTSRVHALTDFQSLEEVLSRFFEGVAPAVEPVPDAKGNAGRPSADESGFHRFVADREVTART